MKKIIAANWKNNGSKDFVKKYFSYLNENLEKNSYNEIIIFPPDIYCSLALELRNKIPARLGCQNISINAKNSTLTGGTTFKMFEDNFYEYVLIGHSENRANEENISLSLKVKLCETMKIIFCVGENKFDRDNNLVSSKIFSQLDDLIEVYNDSMDIVVAYEPIWAIGTGVTPSAKDISSTHEIIKKYLAQKLPSNKEKDIMVMYGGSVSFDNAKEILTSQFVDGVLIGGASLDVEEFTRICNMQI